MAENPIVRWRETRGLSRREVSEGVPIAYTTLAGLEAGGGANADTAFDLIEFADGGLTLLDLCSERKRSEVLGRRRKGRMKRAS